MKWRNGHPGQTTRWLCRGRTATAPWGGTICLCLFLLLSSDSKSEVGCSFWWNPRCNRPGQKDGKQTTPSSQSYMAGTTLNLQRDGQLTQQSGHCPDFSKKLQPTILCRNPKAGKLAPAHGLRIAVGCSEIRSYPFVGWPLWPGLW